MNLLALSCLNIIWYLFAIFMSLKSDLQNAKRTTCVREFSRSNIIRKPDSETKSKPPTGCAMAFSSVNNFHSASRRALSSRAHAYGMHKKNGYRGEATVGRALYPARIHRCKTAMHIQPFEPQPGKNAERTQGQPRSRAIAVLRARHYRSSKISR